MSTSTSTSTSRTAPVDAEAILAAQNAAVSTARGLVTAWMDAEATATGSVLTSHGVPAAKAFIRVQAAGMSGVKFAEAIGIPRATLAPIFNVARDIAAARKASPTGRLTAAEETAASEAAVTAERTRQADKAAGRKAASAAKKAARPEGNKQSQTVKVANYADAATVVRLVARQVGDMPRTTKGRAAYVKALEAALAQVKVSATPIKK